MKENTNTKPKVTILLSAEGDLFPSTLEMSVSKEKIIAHLNKLNECTEVRQHSRKMLFFPTVKGNIRVHPKKIVYADTCKSCTTVHLSDNRELTGICSLTDMQKYLSDKGFLRIHKSYLVNMKYITGFYGNVILLEGNIEFTIGREYRKEVKTHFDLVGSKSRSYL